jgi:hypothetical protein
MRVPREISRGAAARRALLADLLIALALALAAFMLAAGIGIVAVIALLTLVALLLWVVVEAVLRQTSLRGRARRGAGAPEGVSADRPQ